MSKTKGELRSHRPYRDLTDTEQVKVYGIRFTLEELIRPRPDSRDTFEEAVFKLITTARWRVADVFNAERELYRGKERPTDHFIRLDSDNLDSLLIYTLLRMRRSITDTHDLADKWQDVSPEDKESIRKIADEQLVLAALLEMHELDLWYDHGRMIWQLTQNCADAPRLARKQARRALDALNGYHDRRTYHGRPKRDRDRDRLLRQARTSVGTAPQIH